MTRHILVSLPQPCIMKKGFTLIELLVVIAIIGLLMSILIPALAGARRYAKNIVCRSNLKQWGLVLELYTNENKGLFFEGAFGKSWDDWIEILRPFYGNKGKIMFCPQADKVPSKGGQGIYAAWQDEEGSDFGSYGLNGWICNAKDDVVSGDEFYWRTPYIKGSQDIPVFLDSLWMVGWPDQNSIPPEYDGQPMQEWTLSEQMKDFCINRHGKGATNCLFMDWSVEPVGLKQLWKLKWNKNFNINGPWTKNYNPPPNWPEWMRKFKDY
jgi:prepilin-type N-terminal cleavage/methylation domain-containing protein/prepilin-type processing-associated H-X9-DG protein